MIFSVAIDVVCIQHIYVYMYMKKPEETQNSGIAIPLPNNILAV